MSVASPPCILLTGAAGYIGSHTWLALLEAGYPVVGVDNFSNSAPAVLPRLEVLAGQPLDFVEGDVRDPRVLSACFDRARQRGWSVAAVIHFAAFKAVGESADRPLDYFDNNLGSLLAVAQSMAAQSVFRLVFSSSATVYGEPETLPIDESARTGATSPYGLTKLMGEQLLAEVARCDARWQIAALRYFNPVGAHPSGRIGEDPRGIPNNLMPYVAQVAAGRRECLSIYGDDYATPDGTGVRDYIHVCDLAEGHVAAVRRLLDHPGGVTVNLGTGRGHSVREVVAAYEVACGRPLAVKVVPRRAGDVAACWADPTRARDLLGWSARRDLLAMCADSWRWQSNNPAGFGD